MREAVYLFWKGFLFLFSTKTSDILYVPVITPYSMKQEVLTTLQTLVDFTSEEIALIRTLWQEKTLLKGEHLLKEGQVCDTIAYIRKGCTRCYFLNEDGRETIDNFSFENQFVSDYYSFTRGCPSLQNIVALEDCELFTLSKPDFEAAFAFSKNFEKLGRLVAESLYAVAYERNYSFMNENAEQRYQRLVSQKPDIMERVPHYYIAAYLGIRPETLSRIRKKNLAWPTSMHR